MLDRGCGTGKLALWARMRMPDANVGRTSSASRRCWLGPERRRSALATRVASMSFLYELPYPEFTPSERAFVGTLCSCCNTQAAGCTAS